MAPFLVYVRGLPETPSIIEVNARSGPAKNYAIVCKVPVGTSQLAVQEVRPDETQENYQGKVYQWLRVALPNGQTGWMRDDLIEVIGDGTAFGYGNIGVQTFAFTLTRTPPPAVATPAVVVPAAAATTAFTAPPVSISADVPAATSPAVPATPVVPAVPAPVVVPPPVATPPAVKPTPAPSAQPLAYVNARDGGKARSGPGISNNLITIVPRNTALPILDVQPEPGGTFRWVKVPLPTGGEGWIREDILRYDASAASLGLTKADLYPAPMADHWWVRGFIGPLPEHTGWDLGANTGENITCGPMGGLVIKSVACAKCTPQQPSVKEYGIQVGDSKIFSDAGWNFGYGHYIIVRYLNEHLPASTQQELAKRNLGGMHLYCIYAHLNSRAVEAGQQLAPNTVIAGCGDTGNSEATHLHLEMRAWANPNDPNWAGMGKNLLDPGLLFSR